MAKVSFTRENVLTETPVPGVSVESVNTVCNPSPTIEVAAEVVSTAVIPYVPSLPVAATPIAFDDDDIRFEDIYLPKLNLVHQVGDLVKIFNPGELVLNGTYVIHTPSEPAKKKEGNPPLNITVVGFKKKQYVEKLTQAEREAGETGLFVNSEAEIAAANGTLVWKQWKNNVDARAAGGNVPKLRYFETYATALLFIERPAHLADEGNLLFPYECDGKFYAMALWSMKGTAFTHAAKHFFTARKIGHLKAGYIVRSWNLTTKLEPFGKNVTWIPVVSPANPNSQAFVEFIRNVIGCAGK